MQFLSIIGFALLSSVTLASPIAQDDASNIFNTPSCRVLGLEDSWCKDILATGITLASIGIVFKVPAKAQQRVFCYRTSAIWITNQQTHDLSIGSAEVSAGIAAIYSCCDACKLNNCAASGSTLNLGDLIVVTVGSPGETC